MALTARRASTEVPTPDDEFKTASSDPLRRRQNAWTFKKVATATTVHTTAAEDQRTGPDKGLRSDDVGVLLRGGVSG